MESIKYLTLLYLRAKFPDCLGVTTCHSGEGPFDMIVGLFVVYIFKCSGITATMAAAAVVAATATAARTHTPTHTSVYIVS